MEAIALRLKPQQDLKAELDAFVAQHQLEAACILTCVGSLSAAVLRFADQSEGTSMTGKFEILSLTGVMSMHGSHYHMAIADSTGRAIGGHLLKGCRIYTTAEIIVGFCRSSAFGANSIRLSGLPRTNNLFSQRVGLNRFNPNCEMP
jgi:predicted DNA-binding protein with PD1-like motif